MNSVAEAANRTGGVPKAGSLPTDWSDRLFRRLTQFFAYLVLIVVAGILLSLLIGAWPALSKFGFGFFASTEWNPVTERFGAVVAVFGTLATSLIALIIAVPVSFGIAVFITELAPTWLKRPIGTAVELLAAIPSIIYGMWGLFIFAPAFSETVQPWIQDHLANFPILGTLTSGPPMGIGIFTAGLILAVMILPFITAVMRDVFEVVPSVLKESAYGVGATTWEVIRGVVLPYTKVGVVGGIMLGLGRALGETMAVTFVIGNAHNIGKSLFAPGNTIASILANEFSEAVGATYTSALIALGLVLFIITFIVLALAKLLLLRLTAREGTTS
jgi:phosphate transport system permease protein